MSSGFDFNCDGQLEIVYRDEFYLSIMDGKTGKTLTSVPCRSGTYIEFPTIVDVNADGHANIVCACKTLTGETYLKNFGDRLNNWASARKVMNQHNYFGVNINDDLTVPPIQQNHANSAIPLLNGFQNQFSYLDKNGNTNCLISLHDVSVAIDSFYFLDCDTLMAKLMICNRTEAVIPEGLHIASYWNNPEEGGHLIKREVLMTHLDPNSCAEFFIDLPQGNYTLYIYVNDDGLGIDIPNTKFIECETEQ